MTKISYCTVWTVKSIGSISFPCLVEQELSKRKSARDRILEAAAEVARTQGAGHMSLESVAEKAGISKGGLLYHFPSKAALMRGSVEYFVAEFEKRLDAATVEGKSTELTAFLDFTLEECTEPKHGAAGVLAAMAEDPDFLQPVKAFQRRVLDRLLATSTDPGRTLLVYLALEGLRSLHLFDMNQLTEKEMDLAKTAMQGA